jgi:hypothetical protein
VTHAHAAPLTKGHATLVWIDSREAFVVRWPGGRSSVEHLVSDVPPHHRTTGTGQHDPARSRNGRTAPQPPVEGRRLEHLARFVDQVAKQIPAEHEVLILGPGTVREQLHRELSQADERAHRQRPIATRASAPLTVPQLVALLRAEVGDAPRRKPIKRRSPVIRRPPDGAKGDVPHIEDFESTEEEQV